MSWFYAKDVNLYFEDRGEGIPLIFIHPPVLTGMNFKYQLEELAKDFRVIAPDLRGHGKSEASNRPFTYSLIVDDLKTLMKHLNIDKAILYYAAIQQEALLPCNSCCRNKKKY